MKAAHLIRNPINRFHLQFFFFSILLLAKMIAFFRKNHQFSIWKQASKPVWVSPVSPSLSIHFYSTSIFDMLVQKHDFPPELASRVASEFTDLESPEKADSVLSFFKHSGFSESQLLKIMKYKPRFLMASIDLTFRPKFKVFQDLGFSSDAICKVITTNPTILHLSVNNNIIPSLSRMKALFGSDNEVARVIRYSPRFLSVNLQKTLVPNIEFLQSCGVSMESILTIIGNNPNPFLLKPEVTRKSAEKAMEMGLDASCRSFVYGIATIAAMSDGALELKLRAFRDMGFSDSDVLTMFKKAPRMFSGSIEKIIKVKEVLIATGKFDLSSIVEYPLSLAFSVEKRYNPRLQILGFLESRKLIESWPSLTKICGLSNDMFFKTFVSPYMDEFSDVSIIKSFKH